METRPARRAAHPGAPRASRDADAALADDPAEPQRDVISNTGATDCSGAYLRCLCRWTPVIWMDSTDNRPDNSAGQRLIAISMDSLLSQTALPFGLSRVPHRAGSGDTPESARSPRTTFPGIPYRVIASRQHTAPSRRLSGGASPALHRSQTCRTSSRRCSHEVPLGCRSAAAVGLERLQIATATAPRPRLDHRSLTRRRNNRTTLAEASSRVFRSAKSSGFSTGLPTRRTAWATALRNASQR